MLLGVALFFVVVAESVVIVPWKDQLHDTPAYNNTNASGTGVANSLFGTYSFTVIIIGMLLSAAMIGGIYLAKAEGKK